MKNNTMLLVLAGAAAVAIYLLSRSGSKTQPSAIGGVQSGTSFGQAPAVTVNTGTGAAPVQAIQSGGGNVYSGVGGAAAGIGSALSGLGSAYQNIFGSQSGTTISGIDPDYQYLDVFNWGV